MDTKKVENRNVDWDEAVYRRGLWGSSFNMATPVLQKVRQILMASLTSKGFDRLAKTVKEGNSSCYFLEYLLFLFRPYTCAYFHQYLLPKESSKASKVNDHLKRKGFLKKILFWAHTSMLDCTIIFPPRVGKVPASSVFTPHQPPTNYSD